MNTHTLQNTGW